MADHHDAQDYTANGPTDVAFRTGGNDTGITKGVVVRGLEIGVDGTGLGIEGNSYWPNGVRGTAPSGTGVEGHGRIGVKGFGDENGVAGDAGRDGIGVLGKSFLPGGTPSGKGVVGHGQIGVEGIGDDIGVFGDSSKLDGTGVEGYSPTGVGVYGHSEEGTAVLGRSKFGRGGLFESERVAQVRLVPDRQATLTPQLPKEGQVGDLKMIRNTVEVIDVEGTRIEDRCSLWLCIPKPGEPDSDISDQWKEVRLGITVTGIW